MTLQQKQNRPCAHDMNSTGITFGPVPSRRLGRSLGINNIPPKVCSYSCIYCQVGKTRWKRISRQPFYNPFTILGEVRKRLRQTQRLGETVDFLGFVPDGEPTLDSNLGQEIDLLQTLNVKIAVISNASLVWREDVRNDLARADWVSLKIDTVSSRIWKHINRPCPDLDLCEILETILLFRKEFAGELVTETMLVRGINDRVDDVEDVANFLVQLQPAKAYLSVPTRPPVVGWVASPTETVLNTAFKIFNRAVEKVECLSGSEGNAFSLTGDAAEDLLNITAVHPMQEEAVKVFLAKAGADWTLIHTLIGQGRLFEVEYGGTKFYVRKTT